MTQHSRQESFASSFVSTSANNTSMVTSSTKKRSPVKIGPWKLGKTLGKGATGRVFLATHVETGDKAAVKIVSKEALNATETSSTNENDTADQGCDSAGLSYGIEREIIIMKLLNHKNVLRLYDVWETEKALYLILEYVEGGELFDLLVENGPLPEQTAVEFFRQIILGSSYCHSLGICHRDLKPENILLDKDLNVKIADFGMAALESGRLLETSCGSPHYAAPEIVSGLQYHGAESDVWSCGVILFALLTGRLPFDDDNIRDLLLKVQVGKFQIDEDLSPEAVDLIHKMLSVEPEKRIKTRDILRHPFIRKYYDCEKDEAFNQLPSVESGYSPVKSKSAIDKRILENLVILWHGRSSDSIVEALLSPHQNAEKTFYSLLLRYRHDHAFNQSNSSKSFASHKDNDELVRSSSIISKTTESAEVAATPSPNKSNRNSRKRSSIIASKSFSRPVSFQKFANTKSRDSLRFRDMSNLSVLNTSSSMYVNEHSLPELPVDASTLQSANDEQTTPTRNGLGIKKGSYISDKSINQLQNQRNSLVMLDTPSSKRQSKLPSDFNTPTRRTSRIPSEAANLERMLTQQSLNPKSKLKRNSVTSKVLSAYATMAKYEETNKPDGPDNYGKRASSDFAALCDVLFGDGSKVNTKIPNSESMATINKIVFGNAASNKRNSKRLSLSNNSPTKRASRIQSKHATSTKRQSRNIRNSSNPIERISKLLNKHDINDIERRTASDFQATSIEMAEPPKPMSRLDPRYKAYETYQKRTSQHAAHLLQMQQQAEEAAKAEAEIKAREERLRKEQEELELLKNRKSKLIKSTDEINLSDDDEYDGTDVEVEDEFENNSELMTSTGTVLRKSINNEFDQFQPPKPVSNLKSNRYSALSMLSTKNSSNRLSFYLRELDDEILKNESQKKKDRISRLSMMITDPDTETNVINDFDNESIELNLKHDNSIMTLHEESENSNNTTINDGIGKPRSASVSNVLDDDLCFINEQEQNRNLKISSAAAGVVPEQALPKAPVDIAVAHEPADKFTFENVPKLSVPELDDSFNSSANIKQNGPKLPEIPGSPFKEKKKSEEDDAANDTFEIFEDAVQKSKQEFDTKSEVKLSATPPGALPIENKMESLHIDKQRQPLVLKDTNKEAKNGSSSRKSSFFSKFSQSSDDQERKSSFSKTFKALFSGTHHSDPVVLKTTLSTEEAFEALKTLVVGWKHYGVDNLVIDSRGQHLKGDIIKNNSLGVKSCKFSSNVQSFNANSSKIIFRHDKGSAKSFEKLVGEIRRIFINEDILVN